MHRVPARTRPTLRRKVAHGVTPDADHQVLRVIETIKDGLIEKQDLAIWLGQQFNRVAALRKNTLPKKEWAQWGFGKMYPKITYEMATVLRRIADDPWMTAPVNSVSFPPSISTVIEIFELHNVMPALVDMALATNKINQGMSRSALRLIKRAAERKARIEEATADAAMQSGQDIYTDDYSKLFDLLDDNSVAMFFTDPPWNELEL